MMLRLTSQAYRVRIYLPSTLRAFTGTSRTPLDYPSLSPHRTNESKVVQEYQPVVHRLRITASS